MLMTEQWWLFRDVETGKYYCLAYSFEDGKVWRFWPYKSKNNWKIWLKKAIKKHSKSVAILTIY